MRHELTVPSVWFICLCFGFFLSSCFPGGSPGPHAPSEGQECPAQPSAGGATAVLLRARVRQGRGAVLRGERTRQLRGPRQERNKKLVSPSRNPPTRDRHGFCPAPPPSDEHRRRHGHTPKAVCSYSGDQGPSGGT